MMRLAPSEKLVLKDVTNRLAPQQLSFQSPPQKAKGTISPHSETYSDMQFAMNAALIASSCTPKTARERLARLSGLSSPDGGHTDLKKMLADQQISLEEYEIMVSRREQEKTLTPVTDLASQEFWRADTLNESPPESPPEQRALDFDHPIIYSPSNAGQLEDMLMAQKLGAAKPFLQKITTEEGGRPGSTVHNSCSAGGPDAGVSELGPEASENGAIQSSNLPDTVQKLRLQLSEIQLSRIHNVMAYKLY